MKARLGRAVPAYVEEFDGAHAVRHAQHYRRHHNFAGNRMHIGRRRRDIRDADYVIRGIAGRDVRRVVALIGRCVVVVRGGTVMVLVMIVIDVGMHVQCRRVDTKREDAKSEQDPHAAAHSIECMSASRGRQRPSVFRRCRTNAANVSRLT